MKNMKVNAKAVLKGIQTDKEAKRRGPVSLSLNLKLWDQFKAACEKCGAPASVVAEKLMQSFIDNNG